MGMSSATSYREDQTFFTRMAIAVSALTIFGFAQFAARGIPDYANAPLHIHLHAAIYLGWLLLFSAQNVLAGKGNLALHRRLGKLGGLLVIAMIGIGSYAGLQSIARGHVPPHYSPAYFLPLVQVAVVCFGGLAVAGIAMRRSTEWHRRLLLMATIVIADPALDRILPGPILGGPVSQWCMMAIQLALAGIVLVHDRKIFGHVHPATWWGIGVIVADHVITDALARLPVVDAVARGMMPA